MTIRRVAKDVQFLGRTIKANQPGFGALTAGRRAAMAGAGLTHLGGAAALAGGGTLLGLGAGARSFAEFDKLATQAATQIGSINNSVEEVVNNAGRLRNAVLDQMQTFPATAEQMSNAAYDIFSSVDVNFGKGTQLLQLFNKAAVAGMTDVETATNGAITVLSNFGDPAGPIGRSSALINDMFSIIRFGRVDLETLSTMMNQVAPAAAAAGQSLEQIGGSVAVLTRRLAPNVASAGLARLFEIFARRDFQEGMRKAGLSITDATGKLLPLQDIIERIVALKPRRGRDLQNLIQTVTAFGAGEGQGVQATVQARRALVTLVENYDEIARLQPRVAANLNQFIKQFKAQQQSLGVRWDVFTNNLRRQILMIGEDAIPTFERLGNIIKPLVGAWAGLDSSTQAYIITLIGGIATFTLIGGILTSFVGQITGLIGLITMLTAAIYGRMIPAMRAWGSVMMMPGGPAYALGQLRGKLLALGAMAAIAVGLTLAFEGDGWTGIIGQALTGFGAGAVFGPGGAVLGAIIVPIIVKIISELSDEDLSAADELKEKLARKFTAGELEDMLKLPGNASREQQEVIRAALKARRQANEALKLPPGTIAEDSARRAEEVKKGWKTIGEDMQTSAYGAFRKGNDAAKKGMFKNAQTLGQLNKQVQAQLESNNRDLKRWGEERAQVLQQATDEQQRIVDTAVGNLSQTYDRLLQVNQTAMGELFQGPWLTSETFNLAEDWGITPSIKDLNRDLREQIGEFNKWQQSLRAIGARGVPRELLQSLEALGPDAVDKLEVLRKASPRMFREFVRLWQKRQDAIKRETQIDFNDQLKQWNKYGHDIAFEIIAGLRGENVTLERGFENYITRNFSGALAKIKEEALAEFYRENPEARKAEKQAVAIKKAGAARAKQIREGDKTSITINQQPGEDGVVSAKRAAWEVANRRARGKKRPSKAILPGRTPNIRGSD